MERTVIAIVFLAFAPLAAAEKLALGSMDLKPCAKGFSRLPGMDEVRHERSGHRGTFYIERDGERLAAMTYTVAGTRIIIDHTDVDDRLRGIGAGSRLVQAAVDWARKENTRLMPLCPFARSVFDKTPAYSDVRA